jgi:hypothetical protein
MENSLGAAGESRRDRDQRGRVSQRFNRATTGALTRVWLYAFAANRMADVLVG